jgi:hypothetical protein
VSKAAAAAAAAAKLSEKTLSVQKLVNQKVLAKKP